MNVVCFGDSNTFGYDPRSYISERYSAESRWVDILAAKTGWRIRNNGMNGREIPSQKTVFPKSTDLLIIMLGTNDLLQGNSVHTVTERMERFLLSLSMDRKNILLLAPAPMQYGEWVQSDSLIAASIQLAESFRLLAERMGVFFADAGRWCIPIAFDGVHFTEEGHRVFAHQLQKALQQIHIAST